MKLTFFMICITLGATQAFAQYDAFIPSKDYLSVGTGINYNTGIFGLQYERKIPGHFSAYAGAGVGTWGNKYTAGSRYYIHADDNLGSAFGLSYTYIAGTKNILAPVSVIENGKETDKEITYDAKPVSTINVSWLRYWKMGRRSRFNLELGYSILLNKNAESNYTVKEPVVLSNSSKDAFEAIQPGGITIGIGFSFAL